MKIYIAGPMSGLPDLNFPAFHAAAIQLRARGFEAVNPAEINPDHKMPWHICMRRDIAQLVTCDGVALLPGWRKSKGARVERWLARILLIPVLTVEEALHPRCGFMGAA